MDSVNIIQRLLGGGFFVKRRWRMWQWAIGAHWFFGGNLRISVQDQDLFRVRSCGGQWFRIGHDVFNIVVLENRKNYITTSCVYHMQPPPKKKQKSSFRGFFDPWKFPFFNPASRQTCNRFTRFWWAQDVPMVALLARGVGTNAEPKQFAWKIFPLWSHIMEVDHFPEWKGNWYSREPFSTSMIGEGRVKKSRCFQRSLLVAFRHPLGMSSSVIFQGFLRTYPTLENGTLSENIPWVEIC